MWAVGALYAGGADTSVASLNTLVMAMVLYPEVQEKAQAEIDRVVGNERLPDMSDRKNLPYVEALYKEVLRWHPVAPLGVPHRLTTKDTWGKFTLPKGSMIITNLWAMGQTEEDSSLFKPERHMPQPGKNGVHIDPRDYVFGFGRRICPGKELADASEQ